MFNLFNIPDRILSQQPLENNINNTNNITEEKILEKNIVKSKESKDSFGFDNAPNDETNYFINDDYEDLNLNENDLLNTDNYEGYVKTKKDNVKEKYIRLFKTFDAKLIKNTLLGAVKRVIVYFNYSN